MKNSLYILILASFLAQTHLVFLLNSRVKRLSAENKRLRHTAEIRTTQLENCGFFPEIEPGTNLIVKCAYCGHIMVKGIR